jgi:glycosyl-4,4'-diaponeurosporenoate acyltransferase
VTPVVEWPLGVVVAVDVAAWAAVGVAAGYAAHKLPLRRLDHDGRLTRLRAFERDGRWYERRLRIKRWKGRLPEAGDLFAGGFSKRRLAGAGPDDLRRFAAETRRAELTHWWVLAAGPLFVLWNPWWLALVMVGYGVAANVPCLVVQRYNRARLLRLLAVAERRAV